MLLSVCMNRYSEVNIMLIYIVLIVRKNVSVM